MSDEFNKTLLLAIKICWGQVINHEAFEKGFSRIYPFTTENIAGYIDYFDLKNKSLLTVGSSLDQALNAILCDCQDVTVLDLNPHTKYYYYLKIAALLELDRKQFLEYLRYKDYPKVFKDNRDVFKIEVFNKLKNTLRLLDYESYLYWDEIFQCYNHFKIRIRLFKQDENRTYTIIDCNKYLQSDEQYQALRNKVKKYIPKFITADICDIELKREYDNIWLSNICQYITEEEKICSLFERTSNALTSNGKLLFSYLYNTVRDTKYQENYGIIYNLDRIYELLAEKDLALETFTGIDGLRFKDNAFKDSVLIYQKNNQIHL